MIDYLNEVTHSIISARRTGLKFNIVIEDTGSVSNFDKSLPTVYIQLPDGNVTVTIEEYPRVVSGSDFVTEQHRNDFNCCLKYVSNVHDVLLKYYNYCEEYSTFDMFTDLNKLGYFKL